jgi:hypothetical protein
MVERIDYRRIARRPLFVAKNPDLAASAFPCAFGIS